MFSVPVAPTCHTNGVHDSLSEEVPIVAPITDNTKKQEDIPIVDNKKEEEETDQIPKTPSTAERRKLFETPTKDAEISESATESNESSSFERNAVQRTSIAERRKMYESRSQSMQEGIMDKPDGSPSPLRRKDSFKNAKNEESNKSKGAAIGKASSDSQAAKKESPVVTPAPKRTSTVFGK